MLSFELERGLFKLRADGPELEVLLNADPRIGNHRNFVIISLCILFLSFPAVDPFRITAYHTTDFVYLSHPYFPSMEIQTRLLVWV